MWRFWILALLVGCGRTEVLDPRLGLATVAGVFDAGTADSGSKDGGADAGPSDGGSPFDGGAPQTDAGPPDAGQPPDAGPPDAGPPDAGQPPDAGTPCSLDFQSQAGWLVYPSDSGVPIGPAQTVCLNAQSPIGCPADALLYGYPTAGWLAEPSAASGAEWVWAPGLSPSSPTSAEAYVFRLDFPLPGPAHGWIELGADDLAEVRVNGVWIGEVGSLTDQTAATSARSTLTRFTLSGLVAGSNSITVRATNAHWANLPCTPCSYAQNPAGVIFGGHIQCD